MIVVMPMRVWLTHVTNVACVGREASRRRSIAC